MTARSALSCLIALACVPVLGQVTVPVNGPHTVAQPVFALQGATLHPAPGESIADGLLLVQEDRILYAGSRDKKGLVPDGAITIDLSGLHIWPSFVDPWSDAGIPSEKDRRSNERGTGNWNGAIRASTDASALYAHDKDASEQLRKLGVGVRAVFLQ